MMKTIVKWVYILLGFLFIGLGIIGIILPILPTTPLFLLAAFFFVKGSDKFDRWFRGTKLYKKYLEDFVRERAMPLKQKWTILLTADAMIAIPFFLIDSVLVKILLILVVAYKYYYFMNKIKTIKETVREVKAKN
ncbi:YbaN family protein [Bacillus sp. V3B]|uniref:YbaN family protein n=1 Tax=Bacillus sp. V3B TaxID=2804915 RepID=UPI00210BC6F2|nr:YbaN family protein [Bacillus sp. V3B]MCQ6277003.1 YbaN family protein [Bacillus sp. V3B]